MAADPFRRFLGIDEGADPLALLGLVGRPRHRLPVETALRDRLGQIFRHPDGRSADAERVREALRRAAALLIDRGPQGGAAAPALADKPPAPADSAPGGPSRSGPSLTEFDRNALAVLVGCGGWNRRSRAQLVALASANRVSARGLMTVIAYGLGGFRVLPLLAGMSVMGLLYTLCGLIQVVRYSSVTRFLMPGAFVFGTVAPLPIFGHFGLWPGPLWYFWPSQAPLLLLKAAFEPIAPWQLAYATVYSAASLTLAYLWAWRAFDHHVVRGAGG